MRRLFATLLVSAINLLLIAPTVLADSETQLPPCCRLTGKHRCAMRRALAAQQSAKSGSLLAALGEKCPYLQQLDSGPTISPVVPGRGSGTTFALIRSHSVLWAKAEVRLRIPFSGTRQKRGPPALLS